MQNRGNTEWVIASNSSDKDWDVKNDASKFGDS